VNKYTAIAKLLQEEATPDKVGKKTSTFISRLMMRLFSVPSMIQALADVGVAKSDKDGNVTTVQLDFQKLPQEVIPILINLICSPTPTKMYKYVKKGQARNGFSFDLDEDDLPGDEYEMAN
jgi:hypothetical protein